MITLTSGEVCQQATRRGDHPVTCNSSLPEALPASGSKRQHRGQNELALRGRWKSLSHRDFVGRTGGNILTAVMQPMMTMPSANTNATSLDSALPRRDKYTA